ncbi:MAG: 16S rRNA (cytosine(967)-C(5))-methyltransferase RsmB [Eubacteriales bacterium]|nr:16S rRNA (cytosine(967)-C(5))-methyltransferase RsmB [Eubacteriales bacterium]
MAEKKNYRLADRKNPRDAALLILLRVCEEHKKAHHAVREVLDLCDTMEKRDRAFAKRTAEGSLDYLIRLDTLIGRYLKKPLFMLKPVIRNILRISFYQLLYMDKVPDSAVCNEAVELAKLHGLSALSGFVNGVLRAAVRDKAAGAERLFVIRDEACDLSVPKWLYKKLCSDYGKDTAEKIMRSYLSDRSVTVRLNRSRASEEEAETLFAADGISFVRLDTAAFFTQNGISFTEETLPVMYELPGITGLRNVTAFRDGLVQPQDISAAIPAVMAAPKPGDYVIDVCAAPGGKSIQAADLMRGSGTVEARDLTEQKTDLIRENVLRCGFTNIHAGVQDALSLDEESLYRADIVLADLPCSGLGIAARKPDIKLNVKPYSITELKNLQQEMLRVVTRYVKPRGRLVYSTCTITPEENEENAEFICSELGFKRLGQVRILPSPSCDGFFAALFEKNY